MARILLVDDEASILSVLNTLLKVEGYDVFPIQDGEKAVRAIKSEEFDLMISDIRMTPVNGMELLRLAREVRPSMVVVMVTAFGSVETAVEALKIGAYDYVTKPFKIDELLITVQRALEYKRALSENLDLKAQLGALHKFEDIVAESAAMRNVCEMVQHVAATDTTVLISGESGTGKQLVARTLHGRSRRKDKEFMCVDCASLPADLAEAKLFGHVAGALPLRGESVAAKAGVFEASAGGTVYLAEIGSLPLGAQEKLLHMLQDKEITRVGRNERIAVDVRVLAGTSANLERAIREGRFRDDLYCRLGVIPIEIKPLRERREDILPLVYHILLEELGEGAQIPALEPATRDILLRYSWPGNVRELSNALKHAVSTAREGGRICKADLPKNITASASVSAVAGVTGAGDEYRGKSLKAFLRSKEKQYLEQVLEHSKGDKSRAAQALDISLATLYRKLPDRQSDQE